MESEIARMAATSKAHVHSCLNILIDAAKRDPDLTHRFSMIISEGMSTIRRGEVVKIVTPEERDDLQYDLFGQ